MDTDFRSSSREYAAADSLGEGHQNPTSYSTILTKLMAQARLPYYEEMHVTNIDCKNEDRNTLYNLWYTKKWVPLKGNTQKGSPHDLLPFYTKVITSK